MRKNQSKAFRAATLLLSAVLLLGLCACGNAAPDDIYMLDGPGMAMPLPTSTPQPAPEAPEVPEPLKTEAPAPEPEADPDEAAFEYLTGEWVYYSVDAYADALWLTLAPDGTYTMEYDSTVGLWGYNEDGAVYHYAGNWAAEAADGGYILSLGLDATDDPLYENEAALGSCFCEAVSWCDGKALLQITSAEEPHSFFADYFEIDWFLFVLTRDEARNPIAERRCGESFYAKLWKSRYSCNGEEGDFGFGQFVIFVDDMEMDENYVITNDVRECVPYIVNDAEGNDENLCMLSGGSDGLFAYGDSFYRIETNSSGEIIDAVYVSTIPPLSPEEAEEILREVGELELLLNQGSSVEYRGVEDVWSQNTCVFAVSCDTAENGELYYAVCPDGTVYRYHETECYWEWIDPIAVG